jgi:hypothetical protein
MHERRVTADRITYAGLDVHKDEALLRPREAGLRGEVEEYGRIANIPATLDRLPRKLAGAGVTLRFYSRSSRSALRALRRPTISSMKRR